MTISEELLMAYADGELDAKQRAEIEAAIAANPALAERVRLQKSENAHELFQKMSERGPHGENVCKDPSAAPPPVMYM